MLETVDELPFQFCLYTYVIQERYNIVQKLDLVIQVLQKQLLLAT